MNRWLVAAAVLLAFAAAWQLAVDHGERAGRAARRLSVVLSSGRVRSLADAALAMGVAERIERAGLMGRVTPGAILAAKLCGTAAGVGCAAMVLPALPGRLGIIVAPVLAVAGFLSPDAYLERAGRLRLAELRAALPDALDLLAVGAGAGRAPATVMREISAQGDGALARELGIAVAELDCGANQAAAMAALRDRAPGGEVGALAAALERSRRYGSPLADQLHHQARALRVDARRRVEEAASRAAPKIQLVVALVLVPSVLLMIGAAIIAHSGALFGAA